ncbi:MAG: peptidoglycan editing factor PgeF [Candidatus Binatia bacterium]
MVAQSTSSLPSPPFWLQAEGWSQFPQLIHGFSSRVQDREKIRSQLQDTYGELHTVKQVHGDEIIIVSQRTCQNVPVEADGMITGQVGRLLGIVTADCVPVLMVAPSHRVVAALHAGWRGTLKGITARALNRFVTFWKIRPEDVWVAIGPSIDPCCYEVDYEVGNALYEKWGKTNSETWRPEGEKGLLDLRTINLLQCKQAGVPLQQIQFVGPCTSCTSALFSSYRREGVHADRQLSIIGWQVVE